MCIKQIHKAILDYFTPYYLHNICVLSSITLVYLLIEYINLNDSDIYLLFCIFVITIDSDEH